MNNMLGVLRIKSFLSLWLAEVFSQIAMNMANFVLIILAFKYTNSNTAVSGVVIAFTLPAILVGIVAGVYVDRWNKKTVLNLTNIFRAGILCLLLVIHKSLFVIYLVTFLASTITQFFIPAETPMIPLLVEKNLLFSANALFGMGIYGSMLIAYALSGPVLLFLGEQNTFIFLALLFVCASFFISFIHVPKVTKEKGQTDGSTVMHEVKSAFSLIAKTKRISRSLFLLTLSALIILTLAVIGPGFAQQILHIGVEQFSIVFVAPAALGMVIGAIILTNFSNTTFKEKSGLYGIFISSIGLFLLPFASSVYGLVFVLAFILGIANALVFVPSNTILQEETSEEFRGKIYGFLNSFIGVVSLIPIIIVGGLADLFGIVQVLMGVSAILLMIGLYLRITK